MANKKVLGKFVGKCCDSEAVNNNGMFLSAELFNTLIASDDYKRAIKNGYYIGFLGHPDDPNCMDFRNACVIMRDMTLESNGEVTGTFDLIDTPVGRIVKAFTDAGVKFGISIRGAGDVAADGTVDPETFVFRGFDLVTFPAYDDCVPEFMSVAASTDAESQRKYKAVCKAVKDNAKYIQSCEAIDVIQDQFNDHSDEYKMLDERAQEIKSEDEIDQDLYVKVLEQKVEGLTQAFTEKAKECENLKHQSNDLLERINEMNFAEDRKRSFVDSQNLIALKRIESLTQECDKLRKDVKAAQLASKTYKTMHKNESNRAKKLMQDNQAASEKLVKASSDLKCAQDKLDKYINGDNLVSNSKIAASEKLLAEKDKVIAQLQAKVSETVAANEKLSGKVLNLEAESKKLSRSVEASEQLIADYQQAYANSCAYAVGVSVDNIPVTSSTSVDELRSFIYGKASYTPSCVQASERIDEYEEYGNACESNELVAI